MAIHPHSDIDAIYDALVRMTSSGSVKPSAFDADGDTGDSTKTMVKQLLVTHFNVVV